MDDNVIFDVDAIQELHRAKCYYDSLGKGDEFLEDLQQQIKRVCTMPYGFQIRYKRVRIVQFKSFAFAIHYTVFKNQIVVLNILNQSQDF